MRGGIFNRPIIVEARARRKTEPKSWERDCGFGERLASIRQARSEVEIVGVFYRVCQRLFKDADRALNAQGIGGALQGTAEEPIGKSDISNRPVRMIMDQILAVLLRLGIALQMEKEPGKVPRHNQPVVFFRQSLKQLTDESDAPLAAIPIVQRGVQRLLNKVHAPVGKALGHAGKRRSPASLRFLISGVRRDRNVSHTFHQAAIAWAGFLSNEKA